jgi:hypothetical protein
LELSVRALRRRSQFFELEVAVLLVGDDGQVEHRDLVRAGGLDGERHRVGFRDLPAVRAFFDR